MKYRPYEDGQPKFPSYKVVEFDDKGLIASIKDFDTVDMVTK